MLEDEIKAQSTIPTTKDLSAIGEGNLFKLGMENSYKNWVNQYSVNTLALNKFQLQEDRDRKRHMSHKFSLTPLSEFKFLMHPVWPMQRNNWRRAVMMSNGFKEFALALGILESVINVSSFFSASLDASSLGVSSFFSPM